MTWKGFQRKRCADAACHLLPLHHAPGNSWNAPFQILARANPVWPLKFNEIELAQAIQARDKNSILKCKIYNKT